MNKKPKFQSHSRTSLQAALFMEPFRPQCRQRVFLEIALAGERGITDEQIARKLRMNPSTARPRRVELFEAGLIEECGTRENKSGCDAVCWRATGLKYTSSKFVAKHKARANRKRNERALIAAARAYAGKASRHTVAELLTAALPFGD